MAAFDDPQKLNLGRVSTDAPVLRHTAAMRENPNQGLIDGLVGISRKLGNRAIKEQARKEFYEGQQRILTASLEGKQKEELQRVLDEQPWYMKVMGPGAVAEGAVEMASRVGAGRIFDTHAARLASGQDVEIDPDTYRTQVMDSINEQLTGDATVDSVFMPQLIDKGQRLIGTHLQKHLEHNAKSAQIASVTETDDALKAVNDFTQREQGFGTTFIEGTPREMMTEGQGMAYDRLVGTLDPTKRPKAIDADGWKKSKVALMTAALESGNTVLYQAAQESGLYGTLDAEERVKLDAARAKGKKVNDGNNTLQFLGQEADLQVRIFRAKTDTDIVGVYEQANSIAKQYDLAGLTRPEKFKDDAAIKDYVFKALGEKNSFEEREENKRQRLREAHLAHNLRLAEVAAEKAAAAGQARALSTAILTQAVGNNPHAPVWTTAGDGTRVLYQPTKQDRVNSYTEHKGMLLKLNPDDQKAALGKLGLKSIAELAYRYDIKDESVSGNVTQVLKANVGVPKMDANASKALGQIDSLIDAGGVAFAQAHAEDATVGSNIALYAKAMRQTGDKAIAWQRSFGRPDTGPVNVDASALNKALDKLDVVKDAGRYQSQARGVILAEAKAALAEGRAKDITDALTIGQSEWETGGDRIGGKVIPHVPRDMTLAARTGIRQPETLEAVVDYEAKRNLPAGVTKYEIDFDSSRNQHFVIPIDKDGNYRFNAAKPLSYRSIGNVVNSPDSPLLKKNQRKDSLIPKDSTL